MTTPAGETGVTVFFEETGLTLHFSESIYSPSSRVMLRGDTLVITPEVRRANTDRLGQCSLDLTPDQQLQRWGKVYFRAGELPEGFEPLVPGSPEHDAARVVALKRAALLPDPDAQRIAAAKVREQYGSSSEASSHTLANYAAS